MKTIFNYELTNWLKDWKFYLYLLFFTGGAFLLFAGTAGFFDPVNPNVKTVSYLNSPFQLVKIWSFIFKGILFLIPAIVGVTIFKDFRHKAHSLLFTFPIKKRDYLAGKFLSGLSALGIIIISIAVSIIAAEQLPGLHPDKIGDIGITGHLQALFLFVIPNAFILSLITFSVITYFRNLYAGLGVIIILFLVGNIIPNAFDNPYVISLLDPLGENAFSFATDNWNQFDKNLKAIPLTTTIIANRILWLTMAFITGLFTYKKFKLHEHRSGTSKSVKISKKEANNNKKKVKTVSMQIVKGPKLEQSLTTLWTLSMYNLKYIVKSWMFYIVVALGILAVFFAINQVTNNQAVAIMPVTNVILSIPAFFFTTIITLLTFMYGGMLVNRDKTSQMNFLVDSTSISNTKLYLSKVLAIAKMQLILLSLLLIVGVAVQIQNGYTNFELGQYFFNLFVIQFISLFIWALTSLFVHSIFRNTYLGIFFLVALWFGTSALPEIGIESRVALFNFYEPLSYSDLYGYGTQLKGFFLGKAYWLSFTLLLSIATIITVSRGTSLNFIQRIKSSKGRLTMVTKMMSLAFISFIALTGFSILRGENKNDSFSSKQRASAFRAFEKEFSKYATITKQPKITDMDLSIELYPKKNTFEISGKYTLVNKTTQPIDTLLIKTGFDEETSFTIKAKNKLVDSDNYVKFSVVALDKPLRPKDSLTFEFDIKSQDPSIFDTTQEAVANGSYIKNEILPRFGYFLNTKTNEEDVHTTNYYAKDADLMNVSTVIGTTKGQKAFAPGNLVKQWNNNNRDYYEYATDTPVKNSLGFLSATYKTHNHNHKGVDFEVNTHENHEYRIPEMVEGLKASFDYNTKYFSPYLFKNANIIEFPKTFGTYASVNANLIPTSEVRFIANTDESDVDISFYSIAHELTHHWWGYQIMPANAPGAVMISESVTEYLTLNIYKNVFGEEKAHQFLKMQRNRYLKGRNRDTESETTLSKVAYENQYISYGKGAIVFNTLRHHIGEEKLNSILGSFLEEFSSDKGIYPTSNQLIEKLRQNVPTQYQYLIEDSFEDVVLYETSIENADTSTNANGFSTFIDISTSKKSYLDGTEEDKNLNDFIEIGLYNENDELLKLVKTTINNTQQKVIIDSATKPSKVVIDPNLLLIEKDIENNTFIF
ncbi:M1 family aminopeptidase [uncultured Croceitalea sp.]|uniref:ABC transporter permease/M1 family aminopeptidase n=1 Tax=uncultured Croceitalea sp. TaxID=1798908 RepID=UPI0033063D94